MDLQDCLCKLSLIPKVLRGGNRLFSSSDVVIISILFFQQLSGVVNSMFRSELKWNVRIQTFFVSMPSWTVSVRSAQCKS